MKKMLSFALGFTLMLLAGANAQAGDGELHPVLTVKEWTQDWEDLSVSLANPSVRTQRGTAVIWFYDHGKLTGWGVPVNVPAGSIVRFDLRLTDGGLVVVPPEVYDPSPGSITDAPDPVMRQPMPLPDDSDLDPPPPPPPEE